MKEKELSVKYRVCTYEELSPSQQELVSIAKQMTETSYCPYSHFHVGAAARLGNGMIVRGSNQENAAYPSALCAERTCLFAAGANYPKEPVMSLAVACFSQGAFLDTPGSPCGACRQVMVETEHRSRAKMEVILYGEREIYVFESAADLLPFVFESLY